MAHPSHQAKKPIDAKDYWMGIGIALGAGVGMLFGTLAGNLAMGIAIGVALGIVSGAATPSEGVSLRPCSPA
jgi:hypothetical protein